MRPRIALAFVLVGLLASCGGDDDGGGAEPLVWRCLQSPDLTFVSASCTCTGYEPGTEDQFLGTPVPTCHVSLPCCFTGAAPPNDDGTPNGVEACWCVRAATCETDRAAHPGATTVPSCPPA